MTIALSVAVRDARLDAIETEIGVSAILRIRTGQPPGIGSADAGTVLADMTLPSDWMAAAASASKAKSGTWQDASADASGYAGHFRVYDSLGTTQHIEGIVTENWQASTAYVLNQQVNNDGGKAYVCVTAGTSAGAGGPTGTGTGITDGTAVWDYIGPNDMTLDNTNIAAGQQVTVTTFTLTDGNA